MDFSFYTSLSCVRGNLPLLEGVHLAGLPDQDDSAQLISIATAAVELFSVAPRLVDVTYSGPARALKRLPWKQLKRFEYLDVQRSELSDALSVLQYFSPGMQFELRRLFFPPALPGEVLIPPPVVSDLTDLIIEFATHSSGGIAEILRRLTLPCLCSLEVVSLYYEDPPITWDQAAFQRFCRRSECHKTLTTLYLLHATIASNELLDCLAELRALEALVVADHRAVAATLQPEHVLLTDEVFHRLTEKSSNAPRLLPKLAVFGGLALLCFDEAVYLEFVHSRVVGRKQGFESHIRWYPGSARELKPDVSEELRRLSDEKRFVGSIEAANEEEMQTFFY
jgi:hypothetical protein